MEWTLDTAPIPLQVAPELDSEQARVVEHRDGPVLVLAGPGTGKTTTLVEAVVARLTDSAAPLTADQVLVLTFGRRAATEIRDRIAARIGGGLLPTVATFHSFAYGFVQQGVGDGTIIGAPRLLSGAEEDVRIRDLLMGAVEDGTVQWPEDLMAALPTLGLANEVRAVLARARTLGIDPETLRRIGRRSNRPAWEAVGELAVQDEAVMALQEVMDYTDLLTRALERARDPQVRERLHGQYRLIVVDEYQDTDPLQVALLQSLVGPNTTLIAVGDPDQGIYGFRGADIRAITRFAEDFPGASAPIALHVSRRFGPGIRAAATALLGDRLLPGIPASVQVAHRQTTCLSAGDDVIEIDISGSSAAMVTLIADQVATAHVERGVPWSDLAILTRTAADMHAVEQALLMAHIPVALARDDMPLRLEPSVAVLLQALRISIRPDAMTSGQALDLLSGPLCGLDADQLRRWGRALRQGRREGDPTGAIPPADHLMRDALRGSESLTASADTEVQVRNLQKLLHATHEQIRSHATPAEVLWMLWSGEVDGFRTHGWPERLRSAALRDSRTANHDIDAVMALFDAAERFAGRNRGAAGVRDFLDSLAAQELPAEPVAERAVRAEAVRVLTAHRAKGMEWDEVWVVGAQDGIWPDMRTRGSVLEPERLTPDGLGAGVLAHELLDEERRLFYVACTRARQRVHMCVVDAPEDLGHRPSRFITELMAHGVPVHRHGHAPSTACATMPALLAQLRSALGDEEVGDQAAALLAELAAARDDDDEPLVPLADPRQWWGRYRPTSGEHPIVQPEDPVRLSGSSLELVTTCPRRWFLERQVHASAPTGTPAATGNVVHSIAEFVGREQVPADLEAMDELVDQVWHELRFEAPWQSASQRVEAREALQRFLAYHVAAARELVESEQQLTATIDVPTPSGGREHVLISGFIDRLERAGDDSIIPVDLKTQRNTPTGKELTHHAQLGLYQLLVQRQGDRSGGGILVQLRHNAPRSEGVPREQVQDPLPTESPNWVETQLGVAAETIRTADFPARKSSMCRHCQFQDSCPAQPAGQSMDGVPPR